MDGDQGPSLDPAKFEAMVHYVCDAFAAKPTRLGKVKLQKILWHSDRTAYLKLGHPISGAAYVKMPEGPATPDLNDTLLRLQERGKIRIRTVMNGPYEQYIFVSLEEASDELLSKAEIRIIDYWIRDIGPKSAARASRESHDLTWKIYEMGERIDFASAYVPDLAQIDEERLKNSLKRFALAVKAWQP